MHLKLNASPRDERVDGRRVSSARERDFFVASALARVDAFSASASLANGGPQGRKMPVYLQGPAVTREVA